MSGSGSAANPYVVASAGQSGETAVTGVEPVSVTGSGTTPDPYRVALELSQDPGNAVAVGSDGGLFSAGARPVLCRFYNTAAFAIPVSWNSPAAGAGNVPTDHCYLTTSTDGVPDFAWDAGTRTVKFQVPGVYRVFCSASYGLSGSGAVYMGMTGSGWGITTTSAGAGTYRSGLDDMALAKQPGAAFTMYMQRWSGVTASVNAGTAIFGAMRVAALEEITQHPTAALDAQAQPTEGESL